jgi:hypothetical protein
MEGARRHSARRQSSWKVHILMKKLIVFDLDGTLAESKSPLDAEMEGVHSTEPHLEKQT